MAPAGVRKASGADKVIRVACDCEHGVAQLIDDDDVCNAHENDLAGIAVGRRADADGRTDLIAAVDAHADIRDGHACDSDPHVNGPSAIAGVCEAHMGGSAASMSVRAGHADAPSDDIADCAEIIDSREADTDGRKADADSRKAHVVSREAHVNSVVDNANLFADDADRFAAAVSYLHRWPNSRGS